MSPKEVHDWAGELYPADFVDYDDWELNQENSVTNEVLAKLDTIDMNLTTTEDIPALLRFLETPIGKFHEGLEKLEKYINSINYKAREAELASIDFYEPFCK